MAMAASGVIVNVMAQAQASAQATINIVISQIMDTIRDIGDKIWEFIQDWTKRLFNLISEHPWEFTMTAVNLMILFG